MGVINFLKQIYIKHAIITKAHLRFYTIKIKNTEDSLKFISENKCSISRFGDGEFDIIFGKNGNTFQLANKQLAKLLADILQNDDAPNHFVAIPILLRTTKHCKPRTQDFWNGYSACNGKKILSLLNKKRFYLDAHLSRFYMMYRNSKKAGLFVSLLKKIWDGQDIVIVEGNLSRTGVGNDLYSNAKSIKRILGPAQNAFELYEKMRDAIVTHATKDNLIILSYGMTATVLAYDLAKLGYWAIDLGNLDIEYEWFRRGLTKNTVIEGKFTNEAYDQGGGNVSECNDEKYLREIICDITKE